MMKKILLIGLFLTTFLTGFSLTSPQLRCLEVADNGNVTLHWLTPTDISGFVQYEIFYTTNLAAPFTQIATIANSSVTQYLHSGANADGQNCYYYVTAISAYSTFFSDTLATIELYLSNPGNGIAILNWSPPITPPLPTYNVNYNVNKEFPFLVWQYAGHTSALSFRDTIDVCNATIGYRIELSDASGCRNVSRRVTDIFSDMTPPNISPLDSVSVDLTSGNIVLGWSPSPASDAIAYIIYYEDANLWVPIDTLYGLNNNFWTDYDHDPNTAIHRYRIAVLDSCLNSSPMSPAQKNMQITSTYDRCGRKAFLSWTPYENMTGGLEKYEIYYTVDSGNVLYAGYTDASTHNFTFENLIPESTYCFFVKAVNQQGAITASSTSFCFLYAVQDNNDFVYIRSVSVTEDETIAIKVYTGSTTGFAGVHLYRSVDSATAFEHLDFLNYNGTDTYTFVDPDVKVHYQTYHYKAVIENDCFMETAESNIAHNILLMVKTENYVNFLNWSDYDGWNGYVDFYSIQRKDEVNTSYQEVGTTVLGITRHDDNVINNPRSGNQFIYRIEATENGPNAYGFNDISYSNEVIAYQTPLVYIPNAFRPKGGITKIFKPVNSFVSTTDYSFFIFSREGTLIFETHDPEEGWNGQDANDFVQGGVYIYKVQFSYGKDEYFESIGCVTVIR